MQRLPAVAASDFIQTLWIRPIMHPVRCTFTDLSGLPFLSVDFPLSGSVSFQLRSAFRFCFGAATGSFRSQLRQYLLCLGFYYLAFSTRTSIYHVAIGDDFLCQRL
jgi:hypothetical protein